MAAAGFQPALEDCEEARMARESRLKGGCGQNCPPHSSPYEASARTTIQDFSNKLSRTRREKTS